MSTLLEQGAIVEIREHGQSLYQAHFAPRRPRQIPSALEKALDNAEKMEVRERNTAQRLQRWMWLRRMKGLVQGKKARSWLAMIPLLLLFLFVEWLLAHNLDSFSQLLSFRGVVTVAVVGSVFPILLLLASRRKGENVPQLVLPILTHPLLVGGILLIAIGSLLLYGLVIWQDPFQRGIALLVAGVVMITTLLMVSQGVFARRLVIEVRQDASGDSNGTFAVIDSGRAATQALVTLSYAEGERVYQATSGTIPEFSELCSALFSLTSTQAQELLVWVYRVTSEDQSEALPVLVKVTSGSIPEGFNSMEAGSSWWYQHAQRAKTSAKRDLTNLVRSRSKSMSPCWFRQIVAQFNCGHHTRRITPPYHAVSQGRNWMYSEQPDAANTEGTFIPPDDLSLAKESHMRKIDAFAHILPRSYLERLERQLEKTMASSQLDYYREGVFSFDPVLTDLDARWRKIEPYGDYAQVLVLAVPPLEEVGPPAVAAEFARIANDEMAQLVQRFPDRFVGFAAALPLSNIDLALRELDRALTQLGALGAQLYTNVLGTPLDDARFEPLFSRLEDADRAVWLHPTRGAAWADYPTESRSNFGLWWSLGWPYETAAALSRLVYSGHMERHPRQLVIAHHGGGMVPHFSARLAMGPGYRQVRDTLPRPPLDYFRRFHVDTALFGAAHAVRCVLEFFGPRHVLFGTDMPLGPSNAVEATIADIDAIGLSSEDRAAVYSGNAVRLLGLLTG